MIARADLPHLKWSLLFLLLAAGAGIAAALYGSARLAYAQTASRDAQYRLGQARRLADAAASDRSDVQRYLAAYRALRERGRIEDEHGGDEPQLERIAAIERLRERHPLPRFDYTLQPYRPLPSPPNDGHFEAGIRSARLQFSLLHEGQLFAVLDALRGDDGDGFIVERCRIERDEALLRAECDGGWPALRKRTAK